ncbi:retron St85 family RNA-directed DNA polymerase [Piscirickettsia litoralis]|uniref:RNA-directed DNA polymerase n=1 Tax=Piscirickettsia litoralis TaxID=1891921 RepID=A0ABX2ZY97_9GAMM|nr:retron St85 family RNA-directed DNA polymerase [Piscirickettsia litoralis]ODN41596.1 hypothetical protein BGC07_15975 [Piscirickettsia litoralis]
MSYLIKVPSYVEFLKKVYSLISKISNDLLISEEKIKNVIDRSSLLYHEFTIVKNNKSRVIHNPAKELKAIQIYLTNMFIKQAPIHDCAFAYREGISIKNCVEKHIDSNYFFLTDFKDFFHSIMFDDILRFLKLTNISQYLSRDEDCSDFAKVMCRYKRLTIGSPSSPSLSNALCFRLDEVINRFCCNNNLIYSRYADDICISSENKINCNLVRKSILSSIQEANVIRRLRVNPSKTRTLNRAKRVKILGLNITSDRKISIGRSKKREIKSMVNMWKYNRINNIERSYLSGYISYCLAVEEDFVMGLYQKYGSTLINRIREYNASYAREKNLLLENSLMDINHSDYN